MKEKYKLTEEIEYNGRILYRIQATKDFETIIGTVHKGDLGGYVESEFNLSQEDNCWIFDEAKVYQMAQVEDNAIVDDNAIVCGSASVYGSAYVCGHSKIRGSAKIFEKAIVQKKAIIKEHAQIHGSAIIAGSIIIEGDSEIGDEANIDGIAHITGSSKIFGLIKGENVTIKSSFISNYAIISGASNIINSDITGKIETMGESCIINSHVFNVEKEKFYSLLYSAKFTNKTIKLHGTQMCDEITSLQSTKFKEI